MLFTLTSFLLPLGLVSAALGPTVAAESVRTEEARVLLFDPARPAAVDGGASSAVSPGAAENFIFHRLRLTGARKPEGAEGDEAAGLISRFGGTDVDGDESARVLFVVEGAESDFLAGANAWAKFAVRPVGAEQDEMSRSSLTRPIELEIGTADGSAAGKDASRRAAELITADLVDAGVSATVVDGAGVVVVQMQAPGEVKSEGVSKAVTAALDAPASITVLLYPGFLSESGSDSSGSGSESEAESEKAAVESGSSAGLPSSSSSSSSVAAGKSPLASIPACFRTKDACEAGTGGCSGHGRCAVRLGSGGSSGTAECFVCACEASRDERAHRTTRYRGRACERVDESARFWLLFGLTVGVVLIVGWAVGMMAEMGAEPLPPRLATGLKK